MKAIEQVLRPLGAKALGSLKFGKIQEDSVAIARRIGTGRSAGRWGRYAGLRASGGDE